MHVMRCRACPLNLEYIFELPSDPLPSACVISDDTVVRNMHTWPFVQLSCIKNHASNQTNLDRRSRAKPSFRLLQYKDLTLHATFKTKNNRERSAFVGGSNIELRVACT